MMTGKLFVVLLLLLMTNHVSADDLDTKYAANKAMLRELVARANDMGVFPLSENVDALIRKYMTDGANIQEVKGFLFDHGFRLERHGEDSMRAVYTTNQQSSKTGRDIAIEAEFKSGKLSRVGGTISYGSFFRGRMRNVDRRMFVEISSFFEKNHADTPENQADFSHMISRYLQPGMDVLRAKNILFDNGFTGVQNDSTLFADLPIAGSGIINFGFIRIIVDCKVRDGKLESVFSQFGFVFV